MEKNIFEAASNEFNKSSKSNKPSTNSTPLPAKTSKNTADPEVGFNDPETLLMLEKIRKMRQELKNQLLDVYDTGKKNHVDVDNLILANSNSNPREIQQMLQQSEVLEQQILGVMHPSSGIAKTTPRKSKDTLEKERKGKTLGARKKNWISVR